MTVLPEGDGPSSFWQSERQNAPGEIMPHAARAGWACRGAAEREPLIAAVGELTRQLGPADLLIANAGVGAPTAISPVNVGDFEKMYRVNVFGVVYSIEAVLPGMLERKKGHIAAVSSVAGYK